MGNIHREANLTEGDKTFTLVGGNDFFVEATFSKVVLKPESTHKHILVLF